jgi:hypothetical protein
MTILAISHQPALTEIADRVVHLSTPVHRKSASAFSEGEDL